MHWSVVMRVALHGAVRGTVDIDFFVEWTLVHVEALFKQYGLVSRLPITGEEVFNFREEYIKNRNLIAWNFYNPSDVTEQVDIIINYDFNASPSKLISLKVPENLLSVFRTKAAMTDTPYQTQIKKLMLQ